MIGKHEEATVSMFDVAIVANVTYYIVLLWDIVDLGKLLYA